VPGGRRLRAGRRSWRKEKRQGGEQNLPHRAHLTF
jgi:hypothetical protein